MLRVSCILTNPLKDNGSIADLDLLACENFYIFFLVLFWFDSCLLFVFGFVFATATSTELGGAIQILNIFGSV